MRRKEDCTRKLRDDSCLNTSVEFIQRVCIGLIAAARPALCISGGHALYNSRGRRLSQHISESPNSARPSSPITRYLPQNNIGSSPRILSRPWRTLKISPSSWRIAGCCLAWLAIESRSPTRSSRARGSLDALYAATRPITAPCSRGYVATTIRRTFLQK